MVLNEELVNLTDEEIVNEIDVVQTREGILYKILAERAAKKTKGEGFLKDENFQSVVYYYNVALEHPMLIAQACNMGNFKGQMGFFGAVINVKNQNDKLDALLKTPRNILSKDCTWFVSYVRKQVQAQLPDPIFKLILQKEPNPRQKSAPSAETPTTNPSPTPPTA